MNYCIYNPSRNLIITRHKTMTAAIRALVQIDRATLRRFGHTAYSGCYVYAMDGRFHRLLTDAEHEERVTIMHEIEMTRGHRMGRR